MSPIRIGNLETHEQGVVSRPIMGVGRYDPTDKALYGIALATPGDSDLQLHLRYPYEDGVVTHELRINTDSNEDAYSIMSDVGELIAQVCMGLLRSTHAHEAIRTAVGKI